VGGVDKHLVGHNELSAWRSTSRSGAGAAKRPVNTLQLWPSRIGAEIIVDRWCAPDRGAPLMEMGCGFTKGAEPPWSDAAEAARVACAVGEAEANPVLAPMNLQPSKSDEPIKRPPESGASAARKNRRSTDFNETGVPAVLSSTAAGSPHLGDAGRDQVHYSWRGPFGKICP
jgi:hypothetical protein